MRGKLNLRPLFFVVVFLCEIMFATADVIFVDVRTPSSPGTPSDICPVGWFGDNCNFQCHCTGQNPCRKTTGECFRNATCDKEMFGPACQYANMYKEVDDRLLQTPNLGWSKDGRKTSCNPDKTSNKLDIPLEIRRLVTWFRIHTDTEMSHWKLDVKLGSQSCDGQRVFRLTNTSMDISCSPGRMTNFLNLMGPAVSHICEVEISGGRNVAIRQHAAHISNFTDQTTKVVKFTADLAVDGSRNSSFDAGSCTHTMPQGNNPWWSLTFNRPQRLVRVKIYNRDSNTNRLAKFHLELYDTLTSNTPFFTYKDMQSGIGAYIYDIHLSPTAEVTTYLKLWAPRSHFLDETILTICELETYGETVCPEANTYGYDCQLNCSCGPKEECSQVTGACAAPCLVFHQETCSHQCHPNCESKVCQEGDCVSCVADQCLVCKPGYTGLYCDDECAKGKHGDNCELDCPKTCKDGTCNVTNGHCFVCEGNLALPLCEPEKGEKEKDDDEKEAIIGEWNYLLYVICLVLLLLPLALCICFCLWKRRARPPEREGMHEQEEAVLTKSVVVSPEMLREAGSSVDFELEEKDQ